MRGDALTNDPVSQPLLVIGGARSVHGTTRQVGGKGEANDVAGRACGSEKVQPDQDEEAVVNRSRVSSLRTGGLDSANLPTRARTP